METSCPTHKLGSGKSKLFESPQRPARLNFCAFMQNLPKMRTLLASGVRAIEFFLVPVTTFFGVPFETTKARGKTIASKLTTSEATTVNIR
jgi:hypothetical protein